MKLIISLLFFRIIFLYTKNEFDLIDGIEKEVNGVILNDDYSFYIEAIKPSTARFTITLPIIFSYTIITLKIFEYTDRNNTSFTCENTKLISYNYIGKNYVYYLSYNISSPLTNYVEFRYHAQYHMDYIIGKIDLAYKEYDLHNGKPLILLNLYSKYSYFLFLELFETYTTNISFIINDISQHPFSDLDIYEYRTRYDSPSSLITNQSIIFTTKNNQLIASFTYTANSYNSIHYIALKIRPILNIENITATHGIPLNIIDLRNDIWKTIDNLIGGEIYLFFIEATQNSKVNVSLIINNINYNPFNSIKFYEYEEKNNSYSFYIYKNLEYSHKNDDMIQASYTVYSSKAKYLAFSIMPPINYNETKVKLDISGISYELINNTINNITNLKADNDYFFYIKVKQFSFINITLSMNYYTKEPFSYIYYQELTYREKYNDNEKNVQPILPIINKNQLIISFSKNITKSSTNYICFKIKPSYNIEYMLINIDTIEYLIDLYYNNYLTISNIKSNIIYYCKLSIYWRPSVNFILTVYDMEKIHFDFTNFYKCYRPYENFTSCNKTTYKVFKSKKEKNEKGYIIEIPIKDFESEFDLFIEMKSKYDINRMRIHKEPSNKKDYKHNLILSEIFPITIIIVVIMQYIIQKFHKNKYSN